MGRELITLASRQLYFPTPGNIVGITSSIKTVEMLQERKVLRGLYSTEDMGNREQS